MKLLGLHEVAQLFGLKTNAAAMRYKRGLFPDPVAKLACGPIWELEQFREMAEAQMNSAMKMLEEMDELPK